MNAIRTLLPLGAPIGWLKRLALPTLTAAILGLAAPAQAQSDLTVYSDGPISDAWQNWGWGCTVDFASTTAVHGGSTSIEVVATPWSAFKPILTVFTFKSSPAIAPHSMWTTL